MSNRVEADGRRDERDVQGHRYTVRYSIMFSGTKNVRRRLRRKAEISRKKLMQAKKKGAITTQRGKGQVV